MPEMRTRTKMKNVASDRARRENVPRHILFHRKRAPERTKQLKKQGPLTSCDTCGNYVYDDDYGYYLCEADLDEDEMAAFLSSQRFVCPYYQTDDEYKIVRKQM